MDEQSKATLEQILATEVAALTDAEKDFLRARRSYLNEEQKHVYAEVLADVPAAASTEEAASEEAPTPRRGRRATSDNE